MNIDTAVLKKELQWICRAVDKSTIPILNNARFDVEGKTLRLTATDLETAFVSEVECADGDKWSVTVPARHLLKYLGKVEEKTVSISTDEHANVSVFHGEDAGCKLPGMSIEGFPELPKLTTSSTLAGLDKAVARATLAISTTKSRFSLSGALLDAKNGESKLIATDGHRLSMAPIEYHGKPAELLIRRFALTEVAALAPKAKVGWDENHLIFEVGNRTIISRKMTGNFPDYHRVLPRSFDAAVMVEATPLYKVIDRVELFADERSHAIVLTVGDKLTAASQCGEQGSATGAVPFVGGQSEPFEVGLNAEYVLDFLAQTKGEKVGFCYCVNPVMPELIDGVEQTPSVPKAVEFLSADGWAYVVMPMRM